MKNYEDLTIEDKIVFITDVMGLPCTINSVIHSANDIIKKEKSCGISEEIIEKVFDHYPFYHTKYDTFKEVYNVVKDIVDRISVLDGNISIENIFDYANIII